MSQNPPARKKNKAVKTNPLLFVFIIIILILVPGFYFFKSSKTSRLVSPSPFSTTRTFHSSILNFTIELPIEYKITEKSISVVLKTNEKQIVINKSATNFDNLGDYLKDLNIKNKSNIISENVIIIDNKEAILRFLKVGPDETLKEYKIFIDRRIYTIFTYDDQLFDNLDKIARSFRYVPD